MTTIAYDGKTLATDSLVTLGERVHGLSNKIYQTKRGYVALCGSIDIYPEIIEWFNGGEKPKVPKGTSVAGILIATTGEALEFAEELKLFPAVTPWAGGSGATPALTAMLLGFTAEEAVEAACKIDLYSRGPIQKVELWT